MKNNRSLFVLGMLVASLLPSTQAQIIGDNFNVTGSGTGFALNAGVNSGINPPTTRLTGAAAPNLRYLATAVPSKASSAFSITSNKLRVTSAANPGRFVLSADGTTPFNFGPLLNTSAATPSDPVVYDISLSLDNDSAGILRCSFALGTAEGDAFAWDFGFQLYRAASGNNFYTIGKRIDTASSGLGADLNAAIHTMGANTYGTEITILMRVTDAGSETSTYNSRVQLSLNGGSTWFYDTATDANLTGTGWRLDGTGRYFIFDVAPDAGNVTYDNFSVTYVSGPRAWNGAGANGNWSTGANWGGVAPANGSTLTFSGATRTSNTNDISSLSVPSLKFNDGGFALYGNALTIGSAITSVTGNNTFNNAVTLGGALTARADAGTLTLAGNITAAQTLTVDGAGNTIASGVISGAGGLTKPGSGSLELSGASANTFSGNTAVNAGSVSLAKTAGQNAIAGNLTVGDGSGTDTVQLSAANQINDTSAVTLSAGGVLNLNGFAEIIASVSSASGSSQIALGSGALTVNGSSSTTFAGVIAGTGSVTKQGSGTLTLSGANTFSGNTTISAGTLALGAGGSINSSPNITIANSATFDVSAISYSLGGSQTIVRNATSGVGNVNGSMTLSSGAKISLQADGSGTVGTLSVTGGLTLNANAITVNVSGSALGLGTYALINYTGAKSGSFSTTPTITGSGLAIGLAARIVETSGVISLKVYLPAHSIAAGNIQVNEVDLANTLDSVTVKATLALNGFAIRDGSSRGDYTVQIGASGTDDLANGVMLTSVSQNGRDHGEDSGINYCSAAISFTAGGYFIPTASAPDGKEYNINVAAAYFPYNKWLGGYARNSAGTAGGANNLLTSSAGLTLGTHFVDNGGGLSTVNLTSLGINSQTDGVLLVTSGFNDDNYASVGANTDGTWTVRVKDNGTNGAAFEQSPVAFAYVPKTSMSVIAGKFQGDGTPLLYSGSTPRFTVVNTGDGTWQLSIPGYSPATGVLIVSPEGGDGANQDNLISYQPIGNNWIIQSRDIPGMGLQTLTGPVASFVFIPGPVATLSAPADNANVSTTPTLRVNVSNTVPGNVTVTFYGHEAPKPGPGRDFLMAVLPDTQNYAREAAGSGTATKEMWFAQTDWIAANRVAENIAYVATLGDCVQNAGDLGEWRNATNAMYRLERQSTTLLLEGLPYGITVGNHDQSPAGDPDGATTYYNQFFGSAHFAGKSYYGGHYSSNNDNWYDLFSAGGMDFIVISFEYGRYGSGVLDWAAGLLETYPNRRCIVLTHHAGDDNSDVNATTTTFSGQGSAIYDALKGYPNFFLMMGGHVFNEGGEGRRSDTFSGRTVRTLVSDYQGRFNGGNGLMRLMYFSPSNNTVSVKTYSPHTDAYETDANSQFSFSYNMQPNGAGTSGTAYAAIKTNPNVANGAQSTHAWTGLAVSKPYEWYVTVTTDEGDYSTSPEWRVNTTAGYSGSSLVQTGNGDSNNNGLADSWEAQHGITDPDADADGDGQSNRAEYFANTDPTDATSVFRILESGMDEEGRFTLTWSSIGGMRYRVQWSDSPTGEFVDIIRSGVSEIDPSISGTSSTLTFTDDAFPEGNMRYYRVTIFR